LGCQINLACQPFNVTKQFSYQVFTSLISSQYDAPYLNLVILSNEKSGSFFHKSPELLLLKKKRGSHSLLITIWKVVSLHKKVKSTVQEQVLLWLQLSVRSSP